MNKIQSLSQLIDWTSLGQHTPVRRTEAGISVGGVPLATLAASYGTPLFVFDETTI